MRQLSRPEFVQRIAAMAPHRRQPGQPDDHWLPADAYDESVWSVDQLWLYGITDGTLGVRSRKQLGTAADAAAVASCDVCDPAQPRDEGLLATAKQMLLRVLDMDDADAQEAFGWSTLLSELNLAHLSERVQASVGPLSAAEAELTTRRPAFLAKLKAAGVDKLAERQAIANGLARARREGRVPA